MDDPHFHYDNDGSMFYFVWLAAWTIAMIPLSYLGWPKAIDAGSQYITNRIRCLCGECIKKNQRLSKVHPLRPILLWLFRVGLVAAWILLASLAVCAPSKEQHLEVPAVGDIFNPFHILKVQPEATLQEIRQSYHQLVLVLHPDKVTGDQAAFIRLTKAYTELTTGDGLNNYQQNGQPDGPEVVTLGIALPAWLVSAQYGLWVLCLYAVLITVPLPLVVSYWWRGAMRYSGQVLRATIEQQFLILHQNKPLGVRRALMLLSASFEFNRRYNAAMVMRESDNLELRALLRHLSRLDVRTKEQPFCLKYAIKARTILHAHLTRLSLKPATLERDRQLIVRLCPQLIEGLLQSLSQMAQLAYCGHFGFQPNAEAFENVMKLLPMLVQAVWEDKSPLMQLPHINDPLVHALVRQRKDLAIASNSMERFARLSPRDRRTLLRTLNDAEYANAMRVLGHMPLIEMSVHCEVLDDWEGRVVTAGSIVTATITIRRLHMGTLLDTGVEAAAEDVAAAGSAETAPGDRPGAAWLRHSRRGGRAKRKKHTKAGTQSNATGDGCQDRADEPDNADDEEWERLQAAHKQKPPVLFPSKVSHEVHCPLFPDRKQEYWWLYICDRRKHSIITGLCHITDLVDSKEIKLQFMAPALPGAYTFAVCLRSDSYLGVDHQQELKLQVEEPAPVQLDHPQYRDLNEGDGVGESENKTVTEKPTEDNESDDAWVSYTDKSDDRDEEDE
ncbi:translocation protein SEC63 homolog [Drosophila obscura]|uniref:translocation protein SEC63 homolog n=1 Tax=Drosophila obscura TaxID=7282 RepID=UPI001BB2C57C|nr:translocation protein SEC63 homolog [Drosophila obscura]